jgi:hypothetical protein
LNRFVAFWNVGPTNAAVPAAAKRAELPYLVHKNYGVCIGASSADLLPTFPK